MSENLTHNLFKDTLNEDFFLIYRGVFSDSLTEKILLLNENNVAKNNALGSSKKRISFLLVESFQNILKYGDVLNQNEESNKGMFIIKLLNNTLYITSVNIVQQVDAEKIKTNIDYINSIKKEDLKKVYIERLSDMTYQTNKGAGLGFMEMVRKSQNNLEYSFKEIDSNHSTFFLTIKIGAESTDENKSTDVNHEFNHNVYQYFLNNNILLAFKSEFSTENIHPVWKIVKDNIIVYSKNNSQTKRRFITLVELTQNINLHGEKNSPGILVIRKDEQEFIIQSGNYLSNENKIRIVDTFNQLYKSSKEEINSMYIKKLTEEHNRRTAGLGLLEIYRYSKKIVYNFVEENSKIFYYIEVSI